MTYGPWIDRQCFIGQDWDYYQAERRRLTEVARDYAAFMAETPEGRAQLASVALPELPPLPVAKVTHRQFIERLHLMVDVLCRIEALAGCPDDGFYIERRRAGEILFIPPSENKCERPSDFFWN